MRRSTNRAGRVFTLFALLALFLSLVVFVSASPSPHSPFSHALALKRRDGSVDDPSDPGSNSTTGDSSDNNNNNNDGDDGTGSSSTTTTSTDTTTSTSSTTTSTSSTETTTSTDDTTSPSTTPTSTLPSSTPSSTPTSTPTSTPDSTTSTTSTSTSASSTTTASNTSTTARTTLVAAPTLSPSKGGGSTLIATNIGQFTTSPTGAAPIETVNAAGDTSSGSSKGFLQNTGAMAATFSIVGILCIAALTAAYMFWRKKRRSEEHDIFESEYHDFNADSSFKSNDMTALSDGASISGYSQHIDTGYNIPPPPSGLNSNRSSTLSNHAGYGAFKNSARANAPSAAVVQPPSAAMRQISSLRNEVQIPSSKLYQEPAVDENQSIYLSPDAPSQQAQRYSAADSFYSTGKMDTQIGTAQ